MQKIKEVPNRMNLSTEEEIFETLVPSTHVFRKINKLINITPIVNELRKLYRQRRDRI